MKFKITLKDPDGFYDAITDALVNEVEGIDGLSSEEKDEIVESRREDINESISKWVEYNEYTTIEFDTEANTATVCKL